MTKRSKLRAPSAAKLVRTAARAHIGPVPPERAVPDKRDRPPKHKRDPRTME